MPSYKSVDVKCPFYRNDDGKRQVTCEGVCEGAECALIFRRRSELKRQLEVFCCGWYQRCEIYKAVNARFLE